MTKHTPGPWTIGETSLTIWDESGNELIARVENAEDLPIIAAAPDLLAALQVLCSACTSPHPDVGGTCAPDIAYLEAARAAIAKAKGGAA